MTLIRTWAEAQLILKALVFNMRMNPSAIKETMDEGFAIEYDRSLNVYHFTEA